MKTRTEVSAGGVVFRGSGDRLEFAMAARRNRKGELAWGLPKGVIERGETSDAAALREVLEETGLEAEIVEPLGEIGYFYFWEGVRIRKSVHFFLMRATGGDVSRHDHEMEEVGWFEAGEAIAMAAYASERKLLEQALETLRGGS
jgi:8-oxo-dGTP pyrophosphatase MutT (NUDIX family)